MRKISEIGTSTIVVGSSHAMNGVVEELFPNEDVINFLYLRKIYIVTFSILKSN